MMESDEELIQVLYFEMQQYGIDAPSVETLLNMLDAGDFVTPATVIGSMTTVRKNQ